MAEGSPAEMLQAELKKRTPLQRKKNDNDWMTFAETFALPDSDERDLP